MKKPPAKVPPKKKCIVKPIVNKKKTIVTSPHRENKPKKKKKPEEDLPLKSGLTPKQEKFCFFYATDREFFGNGVQSYIEAYEPETSKPNWYKVACAAASRLLSNVKVFTRINELLEETGFNEVSVDKQLSFLIHQQSDFQAKLGAIKEFNKLKQRIIDKSDTKLSGNVTWVEEPPK